MAFFILNALWIAVIFMIQITKEDLSDIFIKYEVGDGKEIKIEPLGESIRL